MDRRRLHPGFAAALLPAGSLGDRYGQYRSLAAGLAVFGAGSLGAALATSASQLIAMRAVMGAGAAFIMPATMSVLTAVFTEPAERARAIGLWSAVSGLGVAIGPTAGGWLLQHYSWGSIFLVNLPIVALALLAGHWLVPASPAWRGRRLDLAGAALAAAGFAALTYTLIQGPGAGWASAATLLRAALTLGLLGALTAVELRSAHPMIQLALFRNSRFTAASAAIMMLFFALTGVTFLLTQIYQLVLGYSTLGAGLRALPSALALALASPLGTRIARRIGTRLTVAGGLALTTAALGYFATATAACGYPHYLTATMTMSAGIGLAMAPATTSIVSALPGPMIGAGSATNNATRNLTSAITLASQLRSPSATIVAHTADQAFIHSTDLAVLAAALVTTAAAAAALRYLPRPARPQQIPHRRGEGQERADRSQRYLQTLTAWGYFWPKRRRGAGGQDAERGVCVHDGADGAQPGGDRGAVTATGQPKAVPASR